MCTVNGRVSADTVVENNILEFWQSHIRSTGPQVETSLHLELFRTVPHLVVALEGCLKTHLEAVNDLLPLTLYDHSRVPLTHVPEKQTRQ